MAKTATRKRAKTKSSAGKSHKPAARRKPSSSARKATTKRSASTHRRGAASGAQQRTGPRWSKQVTEHSDAMDLREGVFKLNDPKKIAASLKRSAERSHRRKADPYRSALSMLTLYVNRAGKNLSAARKQKLTRAKDELRTLFGKA